MGPEGVKPHSQLNIVVRSTKTGQVILSKSDDMRGNTDESWSRALDWLVVRYLLALVLSRGSCW